MTNNIRNEIDRFLKEFSIKVAEKEEPEGYVELMMDNHSCIEYESNFYYIPENCSLMDEDDELLKEMLLATFLYEG
jgi:hypothetical protein